jgi:MoaA/NifB/PqqE/SkfB family radical SAM enzyme
MDFENKMLSIHLTDLCNNNCWFCVVDSPKQKVELASRAKIDRFLEAHSGKGYTAVNIHGGEPTVRKDFIEILEKIRDCGFSRVILQTNGRRLSDMEFAAKARKLGVELAVISMHGSSAEVHEQITQAPKSFCQAVQGIKNIKSLGAKVRTNSVMSKMNFADIPDTMRLLVSLGVDHINISALHTAGAAFRNFKKVTPTYSEIAPYVKEAARVVEESGITLTLEGFPLCVIEGLHHHLIDWESQHFKMLFREFILDDYETYMDKTMRVRGPVCEGCAHAGKCGGVYKEYAAVVGWDEFGKGKSAPVEEASI